MNDMPLSVPGFGSVSLFSIHKVFVRISGHQILCTSINPISQEQTNVAVRLRFLKGRS